MITIPNMVFISAMLGAAASGAVMLYVGVALTFSVFRGTSSRNLSRYTDSLAAAKSFRIIMVVFAIVMFFILPVQSQAFGMSATSALGMLAKYYGIAMISVLAASVFSSFAIAYKKNSDTRVKELTKNLRFNSLIVSVACFVFATLLGA